LIEEKVSSYESEEEMSQKKKVGPFFENVGESAAACLITMVQGNLLVFGVGHWIIASQAGIAAGV
jgi:hypothetical protein